MTLIDVPVGNTDPSTPATTAIILTVLQRDILLAQLDKVTAEYTDADRKVAEAQAAVDAAKVLRTDAGGRLQALRKGLGTVVVP
jgi:hypothetical protein